MTWRIEHGDCREVLRRMPERSVHCAVSSPPYWGLRDYGVAGQLGLERTPQEYVENMVDVFREVRRVLRDDGTLWLNLGDCYATGAGKVGDCPGGGEQGARWRGDVDRHRDQRRRSRADRDPQHAGKHAAIGPMTQPNRMPIPGLKPKDLVGIPRRVAFALQADGWWLRLDVIWHKPNPMPSSVADRPTGAHEYMFLLSKSEHYFYDSAAVAEPAVSSPRKATDMRRGSSAMRGQAAIRARGKNEEQADRRRAGFNERWDAAESAGETGNTRNLRSVWTIASRPFREAHFATFPPALVEPCILAGTSRHHRPGRHTPRAQLPRRRAEHRLHRDVEAAH